MECCDDTSSDVCWCGFFCPCIQFGKNQENAGFGSSLSWMLGFCAPLIVMSILAQATDCPQLATVGQVVTAVICARQRMAWERKYSIPGGSLLLNFLYYFFCVGCVVCQEGREVALRRSLVAPPLPVALPVVIGQPLGAIPAQQATNKSGYSHQTPSEA